ncbi:hypothetical protein GGR57DRAFT_498088 [Xylariaceae sp. FL1272]|nr:hypothetical protein GGR57DRAFT_498088 [Xylariaceae sp. FL1272]
MSDLSTIEGIMQWIQADEENLNTFEEFARLSYQHFVLFFLVEATPFIGETNPYLYSGSEELALDLRLTSCKLSRWMAAFVDKQDVVSHARNYALREYYECNYAISTSKSQWAMVYWTAFGVKPKWPCSEVYSELMDLFNKHLTSKAMDLGLGFGNKEWFEQPTVEVNLSDIGDPRVEEIMQGIAHPYCYEQVVGPETDAGQDGTVRPELLASFEQ